MHRTAHDITRLQGCIDDVISVLALRALWRGHDAERLIGALLDVLVRTLRLDFAYALLEAEGGAPRAEMVRLGSGATGTASPREIGRAFEPWLGSGDPRKWPAALPNPFGRGDVSIVPCRLGLRDGMGVIVVGSSRDGFPGDTDTLLVNVAVSHAAVSLQETQVLGEQRRIARELEQRVAQRTEELAAANADLRREIDERRRVEEKLREEEEELRRIRVRNENQALREEIDRSSMFEEIVGSSEGLRRVLSQVAKVAPTDSTVLILGETGTGKELVARAIHRQSSRAAHAFIRVNCAAIPASLITSELFGHEKGAFTGALQRRVGRFESASGGTIFLDEIGDLPQEAQIALLRVLQEREIERIGSNRPIPVDVRVLAATHRDLKAAVRAGAFRDDLFYRLNVFPLEIPPLRERKDDIPLLVEYTIARYAGRAGKSIRNIGRQTLEAFRTYDWPANVRELQNVVERAVILCEGETLVVDDTWLTRESTSPGASGSLAGSLAHREREMIEAALAASKGRVSGPSGAAVRLRIARQTLDSKIKALHIDKRQFKPR